MPSRDHDKSPDVAPWPGNHAMPRWDVGKLIDAPRFEWQRILAMIGPGLVMGAAAIGGGEWLAGPSVTAKYGAALLWIATVSILFQVIYNIEISRYTLYTGEPIFTGKLRIPPHPWFWVVLYLLLDWGSVAPYLAANAAVPIETLILGRLPDSDVLAVNPEPVSQSPGGYGAPDQSSPEFIYKDVPVVEPGGMTLNLTINTDPQQQDTYGKIIRVSIKKQGKGYRAGQTVTVSGTHLNLSENDSVVVRLKRCGDWWLHKFIGMTLYMLAMVPLVLGGKIYNSLRVLMSMKLVVVVGFLGFVGLFFTRTSTWVEIGTGLFKFGTVPVERAEDVNGNGRLDPGEDFDRDGRLDGIEPANTKSATGFDDVDKDGIRDGTNIDNFFVALWQGRKLPAIDWSLIAVIAGLAAIAGNGGLTNTPISNFTRDQGWGMGHQVGAIPSIVGGEGITLSHVGCVFHVTDQTLPRWRRWLKHVARDQIGIWLFACLIGVSLPSILSVEFLPRGTVAKDWSAASMTAEGVAKYSETPRDDVLITKTKLDKAICGPNFGHFMWTCTLVCGFIVLITSQVSTMDGFVRRWVDVLWTASPAMRRMPTTNVRYVYFTVLVCYGICGLTIFWLLDKPSFVFKIATTGYNFAFAFSAWHTIIINSVLLPKPLRPGWFVRIGLLLAGCFFTCLGVLSSRQLYFEWLASL